jgi:hypothetical protein
MKKDNLVYCNHCKLPMCYEVLFTEELKSYMCMDCGFQSNTLFKDGEDYYKEQMDLLPEIYKDLAWKDEEGKYWIPTAINIPEGMVYVDGTNKDNWRWAGVKTVEISEEEKIHFPKPSQPGEFYERKVDMKTLKHFSEFTEALEYIGIMKEN